MSQYDTSMRALVLVVLVALPSAVRAEPKRDDKATVNQLAHAAAKCDFSKVGFDPSCAAYLAWLEEIKLFESVAAQEAVLALLDDKSAKLRTLASNKLVLGTNMLGDTVLLGVLNTKAGAKRVLDAAKREREFAVIFDLNKAVALLDIDKLGLGAELIALLDHPVRDVRGSLGAAFEKRPGKASAEVAKRLLASSRFFVQRETLAAIAASEATKDLKCPLLREWFATKPASAELVAIAASSRCRDVMDLAIAWVAARTPDQLAKEERLLYVGHVLANPCGYKYVIVDKDANDWPEHAEDDKRVAKVIKLANQLAKAGNDRRLRIGAIDALSTCADYDDAAKTALAALAKDRDAEIADWARRAIEHPFQPEFGKP